CLSAFWSPAPHPYEAAIDMGYLTLCALLLSAELSLVPENTKRIYLLFFALSLLAGFFVLAEEFIFSHPIHRWFNNIPATDELSENVVKRMVGLFSLVLWPVAAWLERTRSRVWPIAAILGFLGFSLISTNRSAALGLIAGTAMLFLAYFIPRTLRRLLTAYIVLGLVFAIPVGLNATRLPPAVMDHLFGSAQYRLKIWHYTAQHILKAPIFGHGIDSSRGIQTTVGLEGLPQMQVGTYSISQHPHNVFLQLWLDFGVVGVVLWGALMIIAVRSIRVLPKDMQPYALGLAACSLAMLSTTFSPLQAWWAAGHIAAGLMFMLAAQSRSSSTGISGTSAGGIG
ncbi:MAG TPA: O-antigen ligase family protein, partial [Alphaproteobacteria bacterium]|nr:O-antigen ligase family protein [Alphaproteobacteria bacterium]